MTDSILMYGISILAIILGFVALLTQKIYIDSATNQPTEVDIPFFGKIKTNIPALVFVFLGFGTAIFAFNKSLPIHKTKWNIEGFLTTDKEKIDWEYGALIVFPSDFEVSVSKNGKFRIEALIEQGKTFEDVVQFIDYSHANGSIKINPKKEYKSFMEKKETLLKEVEQHMREYKPALIEVVQKP